MRAEMTSFAVDSEVACPWAQLSESHEKLTSSGSELKVPLSTVFVAVTPRTTARAYWHRGIRRRLEM